MLPVIDRISRKIYVAESKADICVGLEELRSIFGTCDTNTQNEIIKHFLCYSKDVVKNIDECSTFCRSSNVQIIDNAVSSHFYVAWRVLHIGMGENIIHAFTKALDELVDLFRNRYTQPERDLLLKDDIKKISDLIFTTTNMHRFFEFGVIRVLLFKYSMLDFNGFTRFTWNNDGKEIPFISLLSVKYNSVASPLFVYIHELGHCCLTMLARDEQKEHSALIHLLAKTKIDISCMTDYEWFAEMFALCIVNRYGLHDHYPEIYKQHDFKSIFGYFEELLMC